MAQSSPFTGAVVTAMRRLYPEALADKSWDNTGLLLEAPDQGPKKSNSVLLTIDLTRAVADEAISGNHSVVIAYHPIIFRGLKAITFDDTQQSTLLRLATKGISVYCPHTAVDIAPGGMTDWLCDIVTCSSIEDSNNQKQNTATARSGASRKYSQPKYISPTTTTKADEIPHERSVVTPSPDSALSSANKAHQPSSFHSGDSPFTSANTGAGRLVTFTKPQALPDLIDRIANALGNPNAIQIAIPQTKDIQDITVKTVGLCPGSGSSVLRAARPAPDLVFTGEMSHHDALAITERGGVVITVGHSNSERGYLSAIMKSKLWEETKKEWDRVRSAEGKSGEFSGDVEIVVSQIDRDPFGMMVLES